MGYLDHLRAYAPPDNKIDRENNLTRFSPISAYVSGTIGKADEWSERVTHNLKNDRLRGAVKKTLQIGTRILAVAGTAGFAVACAVPPAENTQGTSSEDTHSPNPSFTPDNYPIITPSPTLDSTHNLILTDTPEPLFCGIDIGGKMASLSSTEGLIQSQMTVVITDRGFNTIPFPDPDTARGDLIARVAGAVVEIANSENPPSEVLVPEFVQVNEMKNAIKDQLGMTLPFEVGEQSADKAVEKDQLSVNVLVGKQSSTVEIFGPDSKVVQREGSNIIQGNIFDFTDNDNDGQKEISPLPASGAGGSQEVVAVNGCSPDAVSVSMGKVTAIYDETAKQWIKSTSDETPSLTPTPEGVELRGDTLVKIDKDSGKILEYVDPKTGEWTSASFEFTKTITLGFKENYVANVEGMEIPIGLGLEHWVTKRSEQQIKEVHIAPDIVDILGDIFMHACFLRYTNLMGNNVTYEEYVELVKQGKGQVEIAAFDEITGNNEELPKLMQVDPREGFALTLSEQKQPVVYNKDLWSFYVGVDGRGRFLVTDDLFTTKYLNTYDPMTEKYSGELVDSIILRDQFNKPLIIMADIDNRCMLGGNMTTACGLVSVSEEFNYYSEPLSNEIKNFYEGSRSDPLFSIVR